MFKFNKKKEEIKETEGKEIVKEEKETKMEKKSSKKKLAVKVLAAVGIAAGALVALALKGSGTEEDCDTIVNQTETGDPTTPDESDFREE